MAVSDDTIKAEEFGHFFRKTLGRVSGKAGEELARNETKSPGISLEKESKLGCAAVFSSFRADSPTIPDVKIVSHTCGGSSLGKFLQIKD